MFDHLDDPQPFRPDDTFRSGARRRGRTLRRRRRLLTAGTVTAVALLATAAGALAYVDHRVDSIDRVEVAGLPPAPAAGEPRTILFVGTDRRPGDGESGARTDTIVLARIDPAAETLTLLPLPRDLWVPVDGEDNRINAAYPIGGPALLIRTIEDELGIEVHHYVETDMAGAVALGDALGGVDLTVAHRLRDRSTGIDLAPGCATFEGEQLLALGRSRHVEAEVDGIWQRDASGDLSRIERQQAIAMAVLAELSALDAGDPLELARVFDAVVDNLTLDQATTVDDLRGLAGAVVGAEVRPYRLPVAEWMTPGGASVLRPASDFEGVVAAFVAGTAGPGPDASKGLRPPPGPFAVAPC